MDVQRITSSQNPRVKAAARLREHAGRREQQRIIIDGEREILQAHRARVRFVEVFFNPARCNPTLLTMLTASAANDTAFIEVPDVVLEKIAFGSRNEGIVVVAVTPDRSLETLRVSPSANPLVLILEDVEKPGNVGAILRTASAAGVDALISVGKSSDLDNPNTIRASLGTSFLVPCCTSSVEAVKPWVLERGLTICAAKVDAPTTHFEFDFTQPTALVLGSEAHGLSAKWAGEAIQSVRIPLSGFADSLNVSVAAAVLVYEALRQRIAKESAP